MSVKRPIVVALWCVLLSGCATPETVPAPPDESIMQPSVGTPASAFLIDIRLSRATAEDLSGPEGLHLTNGERHNISHDYRTGSFNGTLILQTSWYTDPPTGMKLEGPREWRLAAMSTGKLWVHVTPEVDNTTSTQLSAGLSRNIEGPVRFQATRLYVDPAAGTNDA